MELRLQPAYGRPQGQIKRETIEQQKRASGWRFASVVTRKRPSLNRAQNRQAAEAAEELQMQIAHVFVAKHRVQKMLEEEIQSLRERHV